MLMYYICKFKVFTNMATMRIFEVISDKESVIIQNVRLSGASLIRRKKIAIRPSVVNGKTMQQGRQDLLTSVWNYFL